MICPPASVAELGALPNPFAIEQAPHGAYTYSPVAGDLCLQGALADLDPNRVSAARPSVFLPAGLVQGIIEHTPATTDSVIALKNAAVRLALASLSGVARAERHAELEKMIQDEGLWDKSVSLLVDGTSADATLPRKSEASAKRLKDKTNDPLLLVPICNGGFTAAIQTALYHARMTPDADTVIYPVRFSVNKHQDPAPRMTSHELRYLQEIAAGRTIVLHDEDAASGYTLACAVEAFAYRFPKNEILGIVNMRAKGGGSFGEWWELAKPAEPPKPKNKQYAMLYP